MKVVVDASLPLQPQQFAPPIQLVPVDGRSLSRCHVQDAGALIIRSVTPVGEALLQGTAIRFVGSVTSGTDHLDQDYLHDRGITWCHAAGSNADAVVDYCLTALACWQLATGADIRKLELGIVGAGHTGSRLAWRLRKLGCPVLLCDPPLARRGGDLNPASYVPLQRINGCRVVSLHVPLTSTGEFATANLIDQQFLQRLPAQSLLINSCRGGVVDEAALLAQLAGVGGRHRLHAVLDVWQEEPQPDPALVAAAFLATPHIAGYSRRAKATAVVLVCRQLQEFLAAGQPRQGPRDFTLTGTGSAPETLGCSPGDAGWELLPRCLPLDRISRQFKAMVAQGVGPRGFDLLRKELLGRREFSELRIAAGLLAATEAEFLRALGFTVCYDPLHQHSAAGVRNGQDR